MKRHYPKTSKQRAPRAAKRNYGNYKRGQKKSSASRRGCRPQYDHNYIEAFKAGFAKGYEDGNLEGENP